MRKTMSLLLVCAVGLAGCGEPKNPQEKARGELEELGIQYDEKSFFRSVGNEDTAAVRLFLEAGMDANVKNGSGVPALMWAAENGLTKSARLLLDRGAEVDATKPDGRSALWRAKYRGHGEMVEVLLEAGANPENVPGPLYDPGCAEMNQQAPERFRVEFETSAGKFVVEVSRELAPRGADRFYSLVKKGFFSGQRFFRVMPGILVQFGIHGDPEVSAKWRNANLQDDPVEGSNRRGTLSFATSGPDTRTTQIFINLADNARRLDGQGFAPFGQVVEGMEAVDSIHSGYGEKPSQGRIERQGNEYLLERFPELDYIRQARAVD